jgi:AcrR family transcriptional regulator
MSVRANRPADRRQGDGRDGSGADATSAERIEEAALQLFFDRGFHATSVRDIMQACGLTSGALYHHFPSKNDLLFSIITRGHDELDRFIFRALGAAGDDAGEQLRGLVRGFVLFHTRHRLVGLVASQEFGRLPEPQKSAVVRMRRRVRSMFIDVIERGEQEGQFTIPEPGDPALLASAIFAVVVRVAEWFDPRGSKSAEQVADYYGELAFRMVATST